MPAFLVPLVSAFGVALGGVSGAFLIMNATLIASGILLIGGLALSNSMRTKARNKARDQYNSNQVDRLVNIQTSVAPRELVLGRVRKGGHVFFRGSVGQFKEKYVMLVALAAHEIDGVEKIFFNEKEVQLNASGYVVSAPFDLSRKQSVTLNSSTAYPAAPPEAIPGSISNAYSAGRDSSSQDIYSTTYQIVVLNYKARVRSYLGAPGQAAAADVIADFPALWTIAHRAEGVAYLHCEFWYDETAFPSSLPSVTAVIRGVKIFDPRISVTSWTDNPALMQRHVLLHPQFGKRASLSAAEDARIGSAASACYTPTYYGTDYFSLYRASLVVPYGASAKDVLDDLALSMGGSYAYAAGEFYCKAGIYTAPVMALAEADLVRSIVSSDGSSQEVPVIVASHRSRNEKINVITPRIYDAAQDYKQVVLSPLKVPAYIARDGAELVQEVSMQAVGYAKQAHHIAGIMLRDARDPQTITATFKLRTWPIELFDTITLTLPVYGWAAKEFEVRARSYTPQEGVRLTLKETAAAITQVDAAFPTQGFAINTALPKPWDISPPMFTSVTSGTNELVLLNDGTVQARVNVQWGLAPDLSVRNGGQIEIEWQVAGKFNWQTVRVSGVETQVFLVPVPDGRTIIIRARSRSALAVSDWGIQQAHLVVGKTAPPVNVADFTAQFGSSGVLLSFSPCPDLDWGVTAIKAGFSAWPTLIDNVAGGGPYRSKKTSHIIGYLVAGIYAWQAKHIDTTGNESLLPTLVQLTVRPPAPVQLTRTDTQANTLNMAWSSALTDQPIQGYYYTKELIIGGVPQGAVPWGSAGADSRSDILVFTEEAITRVGIFARDVAGNVSATTFIDANIKLPNNFKLLTSVNSVFGGAKTNASVSASRLSMLVNTTETWGQHFASRGWANSAAKVAAGFAIHSQPGTLNAQYTESVDMGRIVPIGTVNATMAYVVAAGAVATTVARLQLGYSLNNIAWTDGALGVNNLVAANFRYWRVKIIASAADGLGLITVNSLQGNVSIEERTETTAIINCLASDTLGTLYTCTQPFSDVQLCNFGVVDNGIAVAMSYTVDDAASPAVPAKIYIFARNPSTNARINAQTTLLIRGI